MGGFVVIEDKYEILSKETARTTAMGIIYAETLYKSWEEGYQNRAHSKRCTVYRYAIYTVQ